MAFRERLPERRLWQFTGTAGRRGSARKAAARRRKKRTGEAEHLSRAQGRVRGRQQRLRIPEQRTERARDGESGTSQTMKASRVAVRCLHINAI